MARTDDASIGNDVVLWRAFSELQICLESDGTERPESWAFRDQTNEVSLFVAEETDLEWLSALLPGTRIASITAGDARECGYLVTRDPLPGQPSHALICPLAQTRKNKGENARKLAKRAQIGPRVIGPPVGCGTLLPINSRSGRKPAQRRPVLEVRGSSPMNNKRPRTATTGPRCKSRRRGRRMDAKSAARERFESARDGLDRTQPSHSRPSGTGL